MVKMHPGQAGEMAAEIFFRRIGWQMHRTQPPCNVIAVVSPDLFAAIRQFRPRLQNWGRLVIARIERPGIADYTGFDTADGSFRACEVKESPGSSMDASILTKDQRAWLSKIPPGMAFVGIFWLNGATFELFRFKPTGSYRQGEGTWKSIIGR